MDNFEYLHRKINELCDTKVEALKEKLFCPSLVHLEELAPKLNYNIYEALENFKLKAKEHNDIRVEVKGAKERDKLLKSQLESKIHQLKQEINQTIETNQQMEEQIRYKNLPPILKLMGSSRTTRH